MSNYQLSGFPLWSGGYSHEELQKSLEAAYRRVRALGMKARGSLSVILDNPNKVIHSFIHSSTHSTLMTFFNRPGMVLDPWKLKENSYRFLYKIN